MQNQDNRQQTIRYIADELTKRLVDEGKIVEGGWLGFLTMLELPPTTSEAQKHDMRMAFFAGAQHIWGSLFTILEPGGEATPNDLRRLDLINNELVAFVDNLKMEAKR
jgi:hypothetical protein